MISNPAKNSRARNQRNTAYTTPRPDVFEMVPQSAVAVLDIGCSTGALGHSLKAGHPARTVSGIEYDAEFAIEAKEVLDHVVCGDLNTLDWRATFGEQTFDCLIFADVLEHLSAPESCLQQAVQYLRPDGCVVVSLPNIRHLSALSAIFLRGRFPQRDRGIFDRTHLRWFTLTDGANLLHDAGLTMETRTQALRWGDKGGGLANKLLNRLPASLRAFGPIREFLTYQVCMRAHVAR